jgi:hypothetical protein
MATSEQLYRQAAAQLDGLGLWQHGAGLSIIGRFSLLIMQDRVAEMASELEPLSSMSAMFVEPYALALAAAGRTAEARAVAARPRPIRRDVLWLFMTGVWRGRAHMAQFGVSGYVAGWLGSCPDRSVARPRRESLCCAGPRMPGRSVLPC